MAESNSSSVPAPRGRRWLRWLGIFAGVFVVLLIVVYFILTSEGFFKGVILPRIASATRSEITVGSASISPFSSVTLRDLKVQAPGHEPLLTVGEVRARYGLLAILRGNIRVEEVALISPVIQVVEKADGTSNLDPFKTGGSKSSPPSGQDPAGPPPQVDLKLLLITNAIVRKITEHKSGTRDLVEISNFHLTLQNVKNGQSAALALGADLQLDQNPPAPGTNAALRARLGGNFNFTLDAALAPQALQGGWRFDVTQAGGLLRELAGLSAKLDADVTAGAIKSLALRFDKAGAALGELRASGSFDPKTTDADLIVELRNLDRQVLNLAGATAGLDFGTTTISSTNRIQITGQGQRVQVGGQFNLSRLALTLQGKTTPTLDLTAGYEVNVDQAGEVATLQRFQLTGQQNRQPILLASLTSPMSIALGKSAAGAPDAALGLTLTNLNLAEWRPFLGTNLLAGLAHGTLTVSSAQGGKRMKVDLVSQLDGLAAQAGGARVDGLSLGTALRVEAVELKQIQIGEVAVSLAQRGQPLLTLAANGRFNTESQAADLQTTLDAALPGLIRLSGQTNLTLTAGTMRFNGRVTQLAAAEGASNAGPQTVRGSLVLTNLTGIHGASRLDNFFTTLALDLEKQDQRVELRDLLISFAPTARATNQLQISGRVDLSDTNAIQGALQLVAESLDLTPLYDAFTGQTAPARPAPSAKRGPAPAPEPETEPAPVALPVRNFAFHSRIGRLYLREVAISNFVVAAQVETNRLIAKPLQLALNGAPVEASLDVDLGVPGFRYDVAFSADRIPLEPLANTFSPEYRGQAKGELLASLQLKGAGVTGPNLQKNLAGQFSLNFTNADIQLAGPRARLLITPIAALLRVNELLQSPVNWLAANAVIADGKVDLRSAAVQSPAFTADTRGEIALAPVLTNSPLNQLPVNFSLRRGLAEKSNLVPADAPTNTAYVALPNFIKLAGTLGAPEAKTDKRVILGLVGKSAAGLPGDVGEKVGGVIQGVTDKFSGKPAVTNAASTNAVGTNKAPSSNPLDLFKKPKP